MWHSVPITQVLLLNSQKIILWAFSSRYKQKTARELTTQLVSNDWIGERSVIYQNLEFSTFSFRPFIVKLHIRFVVVFQISSFFFISQCGHVAIFVHHQPATHSGFVESIVVVVVAINKLPKCLNNITAQCRVLVYL